MLVLICSQYGESHVESVCELIKQKGGEPLLFERYRSDHKMSYIYNNNGVHQVLLDIEGKKYNLMRDGLLSVWLRLKPFISSEMPANPGDIKERFCMNEWKQAIHSLSDMLDMKKWINSVSASYHMGRKPAQIKLAHECGLTLPTTVITNNPDTVLDLLKKHNSVYKTLSSFFSETQAVYTNKITENDVLSDPDAIIMAPGIFQSLVEKDHELRVTIVKDKIFIVKIESQTFGETKLDWRHGHDDKMFKKGVLSANTAIKLMDFHRKSGLVYGAYDFIVDKNGQEIFLECNPNGQWIWLEDDSELSVNEAIANELLA